MDRIDTMIAKYAAGNADALTLARVAKLIGNKTPLIRINALGVRGLRFHVTAVKGDVISLRSEDGKNEESVSLSEVTVAPRKSRGESFEKCLPAGF